MSNGFGRQVRHLLRLPRWREADPPAVAWVAEPPFSGRRDSVGWGGLLGRALRCRSWQPADAAHLPLKGGAADQAVAMLYLRDIDD